MKVKVKNITINMGEGRCGALLPSVVVVLLVSARGSNSDYMVNGKLTSGNVIGDTTFHHILVEEASHSRAPRPELPWIWPGGGDIGKTASRIST